MSVIHDFSKATTLQTLKTDIEAQLSINKEEKLHVAGLPFTDWRLVQPEFDLATLKFQGRHESSLNIAIRAGQAKLGELLNSSEMLSLLGALNPAHDTEYTCDSHKNFTAIIDGTSMCLDDRLKEDEILSRHLDELSEYAVRAGGYISSSDNINMEQWLRFYGYPLPTSLEQLSNLMHFFRRERATLSGREGVLDILKNPEHHPTALSSNQRSQILALKYSTTGTAGQMLDTLCANLGTNVDGLRSDPHRYLTALMSHEISQLWANGYLRDLQWYGSDSGQSSSPEDLQQLLMAAIALNIDPSIGLVESKGRVFDHPLYHPDHAEHHPAKVLLNLETYLVTSKGLPAGSAPLAAYILASDAAPELVVKSIPQEMTLGSPAWVVHSHNVAKIEAIAPGSTREMTYGQVQAYFDLEAFDTQLEELFGLSIIQHILNWGAVNNLIPFSAEGEYTGDDFRCAESHFQRYTEALEQCSDALHTPLPTRHEVALAELQRANPGAGAALTEKNISFPGLDEKTSVHELFVSGDAHAAAPGSLRSAQELYKEAFDEYFPNLQRATTIALTVALSQMAEKDRLRLEFGTLSFYTVRRKFSDHATRETQRLRDKHRGRYGVIICAELNSKRYYYELFTLRAECKPRHDLRDVFLKTAIEYFDPTEYADKDQMQNQTQAMLWPLDIDAYVNGTQAKDVTSTVVVEKLWASFEPERIAPEKRAQIATYFSPRTSDTVNKLMKHFPPYKYQELFDQGLGVTPLEAARKTRSKNIDTVLNLLIPFKGCIEDLASGDAERQEAGVFGCALDALAVIGGVMGVASKFASAAMKVGSVAMKCLRVARVACRFALSLLNPLDGVAALLKGGAKLTKRGVLLITTAGAKRFGKGTRQLRSLGKANDAWNAAKSLKSADLKFARLEALGNFSRPSDVLILNSMNNWYHADLSSYLPRGGRINEFKELNSAGAVLKAGN